MAEVKHLVLKADGSKTELGTSDVLLFPKINGNPVSNPPINPLSSCSSVQGFSHIRSGKS